MILIDFGVLVIDFVNVVEIKIFKKKNCFGLCINQIHGINLMFLCEVGKICNYQMLFNSLCIFPTSHKTITHQGKGMILLGLKRFEFFLVG